MAAHFQYHIIIQAACVLHCKNANLSRTLSPGCLVDYDKNPKSNAVERVYGLVETTDDEKFAAKVKSSIAVLEDCLQRYRYEPELQIIRFVKLTSIDSTCAISSPNPMFDHLLESSR